MINSEILVQGTNHQTTDNNQQPKKIIFNKLYNYTEKVFNRIALDVKECNEMVETDRLKIIDKLNEIADIFDTYKPVDER